MRASFAIEAFLVHLLCVRHPAKYDLRYKELQEADCCNESELEAIQVLRLQ